MIENPHFKVIVLTISLSWRNIKTHQIISCTFIWFKVLNFFHDKMIKLLHISLLMSMQCHVCVSEEHPKVTSTEEANSVLCAGRVLAVLIVLAVVLGVQVLGQGQRRGHPSCTHWVFSSLVPRSTWSAESGLMLCCGAWSSWDDRCLQQTSIFSSVVSAWMAQI